MAEDLANIDLLQSILANLRAGDFAPIAPRHVCDLLLLAIGRGNQALFGDLKIALALGARHALLRESDHR